MYKESGERNGTLTLKLTAKDLMKNNLRQLKAKLLSQAQIQRLGFDLACIKNVGNEFLDCISQISKYKNVSVYNMDTENQILFYLMECDKHVSLFLNKKDFILNKNMMVRRIFSICK